MKSKIVFALFLPFLISCQSREYISKISNSVNTDHRDGGPNPVHIEVAKEQTFSEFKKEYDKLKGTDTCPIICFDFDDRSKYECSYSAEKTWNNFTAMMPHPVYKYKFSYDYRGTVQNSFKDFMGISFSLNMPVRKIDNFDISKVKLDYDSDNRKLNFIYSGVLLFKISIGFGIKIPEDTKTEFIASLNDAIRYLE